MVCPRCKLESPPGAETCDCGYLLNVPAELQPANVRELPENQTRTSLLFLRFVALEYVALGLVGLVALFLPSPDLLSSCLWAVLYLLVAPWALSLPYGAQATCFEQPPRGPWGCNLDTDAVQHARTIVMVLCIAALIGGLLGIWGAFTQNKKAGHTTWLALTVLSVAVAVWNFKIALAMGAQYTGPQALTTFFFGLVPIFWALAYVTAYFRSFRTRIQEGKAGAVWRSFRTRFRV